MDLSRLLDSHPPEASIRDFICTFERVAEGIFYLHSLGLHHGRIRPENVVFTEEGDVTLFGVAGFYMASDEQQNQDLVDFADLVRATHLKLFPHKELGPCLEKMLNILKSKKMLKQKKIYLSSWK